LDITRFPNFSGSATYASKKRTPWPPRPMDVRSPGWDPPARYAWQARQPLVAKTVAPATACGLSAKPSARAQRATTGFVFLCA
jgi:hypothetical protein